MQTVLPIRGGLCTHAGDNPGNQDSVLGLAWNGHPSGLRMVSLVADGVGGQKGGDRASRAAVEGVRAWVQALPAGAVRRGLEELLVDAVDAAYERLLAEAGPGEIEMSTTLVLSLAAGDDMVVGWLGDSRAYLVGEDSIRCLTQDHSILAEDLAAGRTSLELIRQGKNLSSPGLTRCLNLMERCQPDLAGEGGRPTLPIRDGTALVLVSDGVTGNAVLPILEPVEIARLVLGASSPRQAAEFLVARAIEKGTRDNVSAVVVEFGDMPRIPLPASERPPVPDEALEARRERARRAPPAPIRTAFAPVAPRPSPTRSPDRAGRSAILVASVLFVLSLVAAFYFWAREYRPDLLPARLESGTLHPGSFLPSLRLESGIRRT